jgi:hypothetical protein
MFLGTKEMPGDQLALHGRMNRAFGPSPEGLTVAAIFWPDGAQRAEPKRKYLKPAQKKGWDILF